MRHWTAKDSADVITASARIVTCIVTFVSAAIMCTVPCIVMNSDMHSEISFSIVTCTVAHSNSNSFINTSAAAEGIQNGGEGRSERVQMLSAESGE